MEKDNIIKFLTELRESADEIYAIYLNGSCYRLYKMLHAICESAEPYWSDRDNHCVTKIGNRFYDIGGEVHRDYIDELGYYEIPKHLRKGYELLKWKSRDEISTGTKVEKYKEADDQKTIS